MVKCGMVSMLLLVGVLVSHGFAETQAEFKERRARERQEWKTSRDEAFLSWKQEKEKKLNAWRSEAEQWENTSIRSVSVKECSETAVLKQDINYEDGTSVVEVAVFAKDSAQAHKEAVAAFTDGVQEIIVAELDSLPSSEKVDAFTQTQLEQAAVTVEKTTDGYAVSLQVKTPLVGEDGVVSLAEAAFLEDISETEVEVPVTLPPYTSVIVDARAINFPPCLMPRFVDNDGVELYGVKMVEKDAAVNGMAQWVVSMEQAKELTMAGKEPLVMVADNSPGRRLLSFSDARILKSLKEQSDILQECKVIIVVK